MIAPLVLSFLLFTAQALPNGAPICSADVQRLKSAHGSDSAQIGYSLDIQKKDDSSFEIKVKNSGAQSDFRGILMYIVGKDEAVHLGAFKSIDSNNFKFVTSGCTGGGPESTVTHSNGNSKPFTSTFHWSPSPGDETKGPFKIVSIVTAGKNPWQKLDDVPLDLGGGMTPTPTSAPSPPPPKSTSTSASNSPPPVKAPRKFKCRRISRPLQFIEPKRKSRYPQKSSYSYSSGKSSWSG